MWIDLVNDEHHKQVVQKSASVRQIVEKTISIHKVKEPTRRAQHAACIYGACFITHGGLYGEEDSILDDFAIFDLALGSWIRCS